MRKMSRTKIVRRRKLPAKIKQRENEKLRRQINPTYRLRANLNNRLRIILKQLATSKNSSIIDWLGCSMPDSVKHIESLWKPGMSWENYGKGPGFWQTDHKNPCCAFDLTVLEQRRQCYHFTNLQPLWWEENLAKGAKLHAGEDARGFNQVRKYRAIE